MTREQLFDALHDAKWALVDMGELMSAWKVEDAEWVADRGSKTDCLRWAADMRRRAMRSARILPPVELRVRLFLAELLHSFGEERA